VPEERGPAEPSPLGDVVDAGLLVPALGEQGEGGLGEPVTRRLLAHSISPRSR
jgi:hypothetical protein